MKVLVCGGRDYTDRLRVWAVLHGIQSDTPITHVIHGGAQGADHMAGDWAQTTNGVQDIIVPANWRRDGKAAGPIRNRAMIALKPDLVIAFPGGRGTANMIATAVAAGVKVTTVDGDCDAK
jgi:hypothetical protein